MLNAHFVSFDIKSNAKVLWDLVFGMTVRIIFFQSCSLLCTVENNITFMETVSNMMARFSSPNKCRYFCTTNNCSSSSKMRRKSKSSNNFYNCSVNAFYFTLITSRNLCLQKKERWRPPYSITLPWRQHR